MTEFGWDMIGMGVIGLHGAVAALGVGAAITLDLILLRCLLQGRSLLGGGRWMMEHAVMIVKISFFLLILTGGVILMTKTPAEAAAVIGTAKFKYKMAIIAMLGLNAMVFYEIGEKLSLQHPGPLFRGRRWTESLTFSITAAISSLGWILAFLIGMHGALFNAVAAGQFALALGSMIVALAASMSCLMRMLNSQARSTRARA